MMAGATAATFEPEVTMAANERPPLVCALCKETIETPMVGVIDGRPHCCQHTRRRDERIALSIEIAAKAAELDGVKDRESFWRALGWMGDLMARYGFMLGERYGDLVADRDLRGPVSPVKLHQELAGRVETPHAAFRRSMAICGVAAPRECTTFPSSPRLASRHAALENRRTEFLHGLLGEQAMCLRWIDYRIAHFAKPVGGHRSSRPTLPAPVVEALVEIAETQPLTDVIRKMDAIVNILAAAADLHFTFPEPDDDPGPDDGATAADGDGESPQVTS